MKYCVLVGDGMSDRPVRALGGRTPLEVASTPNMDRLAREGRLGTAVTVPEGLASGTDVAMLAVMGYEPGKYYCGRAPLEAASMNVRLDPGDVAFRCNLVTADAVMEDYSAGHISTEEAAELLRAVQDGIGLPYVEFHAGVSYRHLMVVRRDSDGAVGLEDLLATECTPPHDIAGQRLDGHLPRGPASGFLLGLMEKSKRILSGHEVNRRRRAAGKPPATMVWLWGQGPNPSLPSFAELYGVTGGVVSAVNVVFGIAACAGLEMIRVPGATGYFDTNYEGKVRAALEALGRHDLALLHVEATDEAGHMGDPELKIRAIEDFDRRVVGPVLEGLAAAGPARVLLCPDHATPLEVRGHVHDDVPYVMWGEGVPACGAAGFWEAEARRLSPEPLPGHVLMRELLAPAVR